MDTEDIAGLAKGEKVPKVKKKHRKKRVLDARKRRK